MSLYWIYHDLLSFSITLAVFWFRSREVSLSQTQPCPALGCGSQHRSIQPAGFFPRRREGCSEPWAAQSTADGEAAVGTPHLTPTTRLMPHIQKPPSASPPRISQLTWVWSERYFTKPFFSRSATTVDHWRWLGTPEVLQFPREKMTKGLRLQLVAVVPSNKTRQEIWLIPTMYQKQKNKPPWFLTWLICPRSTLQVFVQDKSRKDNYTNCTKTRNRK